MSSKRKSPKLEAKAHRDQKRKDRTAARARYRETQRLADETEKEARHGDPTSN